MATSCVTSGKTRQPDTASSARTVQPSVGFSMQTCKALDSIWAGNTSRRATSDAGTNWLTRATKSGYTVINDGLTAREPVISSSTPRSVSAGTSCRVAMAPARVEPRVRWNARARSMVAAGRMPCRRLNSASRSSSSASVTDGSPAGRAAVAQPPGPGGLAATSSPHADTRRSLRERVLDCRIGARG